jgi:hypothetical protein
MNHSIEVSYQKGIYNIICSFHLQIIEQIFGIKSSKEANKKAIELKNNYEKKGIRIENMILWDN